MLSEQLRNAILSSGETPHRLSLRAQVPPQSTYRFLSGERDLSLSSAERLAEVVGVGLTPVGGEAQHAEVPQGAQEADGRFRAEITRGVQEASDRAGDLAGLLESLGQRCRECD